MKKNEAKSQEKSSLEVVRMLSRVALDNKAIDLVVLSVREISSFADYFVIMSGHSTRHVQGLAEIINDELRKKRIKNSNTEGLEEGLWVLLDFNDILVHIFYHETREFYNLEGLWHDAPRLEIEEMASVAAVN